MGTKPNPDQDPPKPDPSTDVPPGDRAKDKLREKLEKLKKKDPNVYPLF